MDATLVEHESSGIQRFLRSMHSSILLLSLVEN
jgi:hypothetical protein